VPWLEVYGEGALTLATTLVDVPCSIIEDLEHWHESIGVAICASDVRFACANAVHCDSNTSRILADDSRLPECIVDTLN